MNEPSNFELDTHTDYLWSLHERLAFIAYELEKDPHHEATAKELWMVITTLEALLRGVIQEALEDEDEEDDFVDYGDIDD